MAGIATKYVIENGLNNKMSIKEFTQHMSEFNILLTNKVKRDQARQCFQKRYNFNKEQVFALIPKLTADQKKGEVISHNTSDTPDILQEVEPVEGGTVNMCQILQKETIRDLA